MILKKCLIAVAAAICFIGNAHAQSSPASATDSGLALEIVYLKGRAPAYQALSPKQIGGSWYGLFGRIAGWQQPKGSLPVNAVRLVPYLKDGTVSVNVSVLRGEFLDTEDKVAVYQAPENEVITIEELKAFGVEPFVIRLIRTASNSALPTTLNKTKSVAIVGLEPMASTLPSYKLTLHNLSDKNISGLSVKIMSQGRVRRTGFRSNDYGEALVKARESCHLRMALAMTANPTAAGYEPSTPQDQQIVIESLIFEDGSYEGEVKPAGQFLAFAVGQRIELKRILPLFEAALADAAASPNSLRAQISSLGFEVNEADVSPLAAAFSTWEKGEPRLSVDFAIHELRKDLLNDLQQLQKSDPNGAAFKAWLMNTRKVYSSWLAHLEAINI